MCSHLAPGKNCYTIYQQRKYFTAQIQGRWLLTREWSITGGYRYLYRESDGFGLAQEDFGNHEIRVGISWQPLVR